MWNSHPRSDEWFSETKVVYAEYQMMMLAQHATEIQEWTASFDKYLTSTGNKDEQIYKFK